MSPQGAGRASARSSRFGSWQVYHNPLAPARRAALNSHPSAREQDIHVPKTVEKRSQESDEYQAERDLLHPSLGKGRGGGTLCYTVVGRVQRLIPFGWGGGEGERRGMDVVPETSTEGT